MVDDKIIHHSINFCSQKMPKCNNISVCMSKCNNVSLCVEALQWGSILLESQKS